MKLRDFQPARFVQKCLTAGLLATALCGAPAFAQLPTIAPGSIEEGCWKARASMAQNSGDTRALLLSLSARLGEARGAYSQAYLAWTLAQGAEKYLRSDPTTSQRLESAAENCLTGIGAWSSLYGQMQEIHGDREPVWIHSQPEAVALAVLGWTTLERVRPSPTRHDLIQKFAQGLVLLHRPEPHHYPFRAHTSFAPGRPDCPGYAPILERVSLAQVSAAVPDGEEAPSGEEVGASRNTPQLPTLREIGKAPGAMWIPERNRQAEALFAAYSVVGDKAYLEEAQQEVLGMWTHLVVSGRLPESFSPQPEGKANLRTASVAVDQLVAAYRATNSPVYKALLGVASHWERQLAPQSESERAAQTWLHGQLSAFAEKSLTDVYPPVSYQIMQAEDGKAVQKAFELVDIHYPGGSPGKMARVGRENMFWMRFDVDREADYFFYMVFLKSKLEGGLISVMMRIDGDKIFKVPLGGATDAFVDMDFVDGPRPLRQGPHSFGIRFSGLLMTQPALLDCVIAWPVVERRFLKLDGNRRMLLLHNRSPKPARATFPEVGQHTPDTHVVDGSGVAATLGREVDKRRRKEYLVLPPAGTAVLEWNEGNSTTVP